MYVLSGKKKKIVQNSRGIAIASGRIARFITASLDVRRQTFL